MATGFQIVVVFIILCAFSACVDERIPPYVALRTDAARIEDYRVVAERGNAREQYNLGVRYERGQGVSQDWKEAIRWYEAAAMQRHPDALYKLCVMSDLGRGMPQDYMEALRWCGLAADQGQSGAMFTLGVHYYMARGVVQDLAQAYRWYNLAAANGYEDGAKWRDRVALLLTPAQIAQAQMLAREWRPTTFLSPE